jgi:hypothetical protein
MHKYYCKPYTTSTANHTLEKIATYYMPWDAKEFIDLIQGEFRRLEFRRIPEPIEGFGGYIGILMVSGSKLYRQYD